MAPCKCPLAGLDKALLPGCFVTFEVSACATGVRRWALDNVATYGTPACIPTLAQLQSDPSFMSRMARDSASGNATSVDMVQSGSDDRVRRCSPFGVETLAGCYASASRANSVTSSVCGTCALVSASGCSAEEDHATYLRGLCMRQIARHQRSPIWCAHPRLRSI